EQLLQVLGLLLQFLDGERLVSHWSRWRQFLLFRLWLLRIHGSTSGPESRLRRGRPRRGQRRETELPKQRMDVRIVPAVFACFVHQPLHGVLGAHNRLIANSQLVRLFGFEVVTDPKPAREKRQHKEYEDQSRAKGIISEHLSATLGRGGDGAKP